MIDMIFLLVKSAPRGAFFVISVFDNQLKAYYVSQVGTF